MMQTKVAQGRFVVILASLLCALKHANVLAETKFFDALFGQIARAPIGREKRVTPQELALGLVADRDNARLVFPAGGPILEHRYPRRLPTPFRIGPEVGPQRIVKRRDLIREFVAVEVGRRDVIPVLASGSAGTVRRRRGFFLMSSNKSSEGCDGPAST